MSKKISELDLLSTTPGSMAADDLFVFVDVNDPTMAPSGTTKRVKAEHLLDFAGLFYDGYGFIFNQDTVFQPASTQSINILGPASQSLYFGTDSFSIIVLGVEFMYCDAADYMTSYSIAGRLGLFASNGTTVFLKINEAHAVGGHYLYLYLGGDTRSLYVLGTAKVDQDLTTTATPTFAGTKITEGANASMGLATLVGGSATVATTKVTANSRIFLTSQSGGGTPGWVRVSARTPGTNFTITSSSGTDTSTIAWMIVEPA